MDSKICRVIDFDNTITRMNTFRAHKITKERNEPDSIQYINGKTFISVYQKDNVESVVIHNVQNILAIATHNNNPDFIAGCLAGLLKMELKHNETRDCSTDSAFSLDVWETEGLEQPILIAFCNKLNDQHSGFMQSKPNKNAQIADIRNFLLINTLIQENTMLDFYDDSNRNIAAAGYLDYVRVHPVLGSDPVFRESVEPIPTQSMDNDPVITLIQPNLHGFFQNPYTESPSSSAKRRVLAMASPPSNDQEEPNVVSRIEPPTGF